jgi:protein SCO1/2
MVVVFMCIVVIAGMATALVWHRAGPSIELATGTYLTPSRPIADFSLIDHHGRTFGPANFRGHWTFLFFGYTNCPDFCPTTLTTLAAMQKQLRAVNSTVRPQVVFMSVDAKYDTPAQLARYVPYFDPEFIGITAADQPSIEAVAAKLGVTVLITPRPDGSYTVDHSGSIFVLNPQGRLAAVLNGPYTADALAHDFTHIVAGRS